MARFFKDRTASRGMVPGSLVLIGNQRMEKPEIQVMEVDGEELQEKKPDTLTEALESIGRAPVTWINIWGLHDLKMMEQLGQATGMEPLHLEDILNTDQRPMYSEGNGYDLLILKMLGQENDGRQMAADQLSLILGPNYVITLQEQVADMFDPVRLRIRNTRKRVRFIHPDYLAYALIDTMVDQYIQVTESLGRKVESLEEKIFTTPDPAVIEEIYRLKTELSFIRKSVRPVREITLQVLKSESGLFREEYLHYLKDLNDLVVQATEAIELYSGMISDHLNIYSTNVSNRTNEVMKVLTIFAALFIPLTFLAGIYGMNFQHIPELAFRYSYLVFWIVVILIAAGMLLYFKRKKWL